MKIVLVTQDCVELPSKDGFRNYEAGDVHYNFMPTTEQIDVLRNGGYVILTRSQGGALSINVAMSPREHQIVERK